MARDLTAALAEILARADGGESITPGWLRRHYPDFQDDLLEALQIARRLTSVEAFRQDRLARAGEFVLHEELGRGSSGAVFRARRPEADREYALKIVPRENAAEDAAALRGLVGVRSRHLVRCLDIGPVSWRGGTAVAIRMEIVNGVDLDERLAIGGPLPESECRRLALEIASALGAMHSAGWIHADVKPRNIRLAHDGSATLMDLDLARRIASRPLEPLEFMGSLSYAAPEQLAAQTLSPATDLYALGATLCEAAGGDPTAASFEGTSSLPVSPFFRSLLHELVQPDPALRPGSASELVRILREGETGGWWSRRRDEPRHPAFPQRGALRGREEELGWLRSSLERVRSGRLVAAHVVGEAGIGKTRLLEEFSRSVSQEGAAGRTVWINGAHPSPISAALRQVGLDDSAARTPIDVRQAGARLRGVAAGLPLLLVVDDVHLLSRDSRRLLLGMAAELRRAPVLMVTCARQDLSESVSFAGAPRKMTLGPLDEATIAALVGEQAAPALREAGAVSGIARRAGGNPFYALALAALWAVPTRRSARQRASDHAIPPSVQEILAARLSHLSPRERRVLQAASCCGDVFEERRIGQAMPGRDAERQWEGLERQGILSPVADGRRRFSHQLLREFVYEQMPARRKRWFHHRLADQFAACIGSEPGNGGEVCRHYFEAGRPELAARFLDDAVRRLSAAGRHGDVILLSERASAEGAFVDDDQRTRIVCARVRAAGRVGSADPEALLRELDSCLAATIAEPVRLQALVARSDHVLQRGDAPSAVEALQEALPLARRLGAEEDFDVSTRLAQTLVSASRYDEAGHVLRQVLRRARADGNADRTSFAVTSAARILDMRGRVDAAARAARRGLAWARRAKNRDAEHHATLMLASMEGRRGRVREAYRLAREALRLARELGDGRRELRALMTLGTNVRVRGYREQARRYLMDGLSLARARTDLFCESDALHGLAQCATADGDHATARQRLEECMAAAVEVDSVPMRAFASFSRAINELLVQDAPRALDALGEARRICERAGMTLGVLVSESYEAQIRARFEPSRSNTARLGACIERLRESGFSGEALPALNVYGALLLERGRVSDAAKVFRETWTEGRKVDAPSVAVPGLVGLLHVKETGVDQAIRAYRRFERRLRFPIGIRIGFDLWRAGGDLDSLIRARRLIERVRTCGPRDRIDRLLGESPLYGPVLDAWEGRIMEGPEN